jgi:hypothetical protein
MKNAVSWDVTPCGSCKNRRPSETSVFTRATRCNIQEDSILPLLTFFWIGSSVFVALENKFIQIVFIGDIVYSGCGLVGY